jgi:hypothetical protein
VASCPPPPPGCNFYCEARVTDPGRLCVAVGLGFFLEMTLPEALLYIQKRDGQLAAQAAQLTKQAAHIKVGSPSLDLILLYIILCKKCILMQLPRIVVNQVNESNNISG